MDSAQNDSDSRARFILKRLLFAFGVAVSAAMILVPISEMDADHKPADVSVIEIQVLPSDDADSIGDRDQEDSPDSEKIVMKDEFLGEIKTAAVADN